MVARHTATVIEEDIELTPKCGTCNLNLYFLSIFGFDFLFCTQCGKGKGYSRGCN